MPRLSLTFFNRQNVFLDKFIFGDKLKVKVMFFTKENSNDFENGPRSSEIIFVFQPSLVK